MMTAVAVIERKYSLPASRELPVRSGCWLPHFCGSEQVRISGRGALSLAVL